MSQDSIKCPKCGMAIPLSEALSHDIEERARLKYEKQIAEDKQKYDLGLRELEKNFDNRLRKQREDLEAKLKKQAEEAVGADLADLKTQVEEGKRKLKQAQEIELSLRKRQPEREK